MSPIWRDLIWSFSFPYYSYDHWKICFLIKTPLHLAPYFLLWLALAMLSTDTLRGPCVNQAIHLDARVSEKVGQLLMTTVFYKSVWLNSVFTSGHVLVQYDIHEEMNSSFFITQSYLKTSNTSRTIVVNKIVDPSDVVGASPVGVAPTISSFST